LAFSLSCSTTSPLTNNTSLILSSSTVAKSICTGNLPPNVTLADNTLYLKIGNLNNLVPTTAPDTSLSANTTNGVCKAGTSTQSGTPFVCSSDGLVTGSGNVPTGSATGGQTIWAYLRKDGDGTANGYNIFTDTLYKTNVYSQKSYSSSRLNFDLSVNNNKVPIYGDIKKVNSTDQVGVKLTNLNIYTDLGLRDNTKIYTCYFYAKQTLDTNWRPLKYNPNLVVPNGYVNKNEGVLYDKTNNNGCSTNFNRSSVLKAYTNGNGDQASDVVNQTNLSSPINRYEWEFRVDVRESSTVPNSSTPSIGDRLVESKKGNLNLQFVGALRG
jgi:hypothetical protein